MKFKALKGEVKEFLEKFSYKEDNSMRRNASLIITHMSATDRETDRLRDSPEYYSVEFYAN